MTGDAAILASRPYGEDPSAVTPEQGADFMKELCNLVSGALKRVFSGAGIQAGISLPLLTRGFDEIFFPMANEITVLEDVVRVDLLTRIKGLTFHQAWPRRLMKTLGGVRIPVISIGHLIRSKRAAGRPIDQQDVTTLRTIKRLTR